MLILVVILVFRCVVSAMLSGTNTNVGWSPFVSLDTATSEYKYINIQDSQINIGKILYSNYIGVNLQ